MRPAVSTMIPTFMSLLPHRRKLYRLIRRHLWENPITVGPLDLTDYYFEHKVSQLDAENRALPIIEEVSAEYGELTGRRYHHFESYKLDDADTAIVILGSSAGTMKAMKR